MIIFMLTHLPKPKSDAFGETFTSHNLPHVGCIFYFHHKAQTSFRDSKICWKMFDSPKHENS